MPRIQTDDPKTFIADAALRLISHAGIASLTTASLARELNITPGALYRHFASRDAILIATAERARLLLDRDLPQHIEDPIERLDHFVKARTGTARQHIGVVRLVTSEQFAKAIPDAAVEHLRAAIDASRRFFAQAIMEGQQQGQIRTDLPTPDLVLIAMGTMQLLALGASGWCGGFSREQGLSAWATFKRLLRPV